MNYYGYRAILKCDCEENCGKSNSAAPLGKTMTWFPPDWDFAHLSMVGKNSSSEKDISTVTLGVRRLADFAKPSKS
jgi:hypothetical protein